MEKGAETESREKMYWPQCVGSLRSPVSLLAAGEASVYVVCDGGVVAKICNNVFEPRCSGNAIVEENR